MEGSAGVDTPTRPVIPDAIISSRSELCVKCETCGASWYYDDTQEYGFATLSMMGIDFDEHVRNFHND